MGARPIEGSGQHRGGLRCARPRMIMLGKSCWLVLALVCSSANAAERECMPDHETFKIASSAMQEDRTINVYLPPTYGVDTKAVFPVVYMPDGGEMEDFPH